MTPPNKAFGDMADGLVVIHVGDEVGAQGQCGRDRGCSLDNLGEVLGRVRAIVHRGITERSQ